MGHHCNIEPVSCEGLIDLHISKTNRIFISNEYGRNGARDAAMRKIITDILFCVISHPDIFIYTKKPFHYRCQYLKSLEPKSKKLVNELVDSFLRGDEPQIYFNKTELVQAFDYYGAELPEADSLPIRSQQEDFRLWFDFMKKLKQEEASIANGVGGMRLDEQEEGIANAEHARQWRELAESLQGREARAALCAAYKWEGLTHIDAYNTIFPGKVVEDTSKASYISKLSKEAKRLANKHGLKLPGWDSKGRPT